MLWRKGQGVAKEHHMIKITPNGCDFKGRTGSEHTHWKQSAIMRNCYCPIKATARIFSVIEKHGIATFHENHEERCQQWLWLCKNVPLYGQSKRRATFAWLKLSYFHTIRSRPDRVNYWALHLLQLEAHTLKNSGLALLNVAANLYVCGL